VDIQLVKVWFDFANDIGGVDMIVNEMDNFFFEEKMKWILMFVY